MDDGGVGVLALLIVGGEEPSGVGGSEGKLVAVGVGQVLRCEGLVIELNRIHLKEVALSALEELQRHAAIITSKNRCCYN